MTLTTTEVKVNFFRPVTKGILVAKVKIIHSGKRTAVGEAEIEDGEGRLIAKGTAGHLIV
jgi:acyl-CoA thioesterase